MLKPNSTLDLVDALYLASILANQPRAIDRYIDYFGGGGGLEFRDGDARLGAHQPQETWR